MPLKALLQVNKETYSSREPVFMRLTVTNPNQEVFSSAFSSAQKYEFIVKSNGTEVWRWSRGKAFTMMLKHFKLEPGESMRFRGVWNQRDKQGNLVAPGKYEITGILKTRPLVTSQSITIKITQEEGRNAR